MTGPFGPVRTPAQTLNVAWEGFGAQIRHDLRRLWGTSTVLLDTCIPAKSNLFDSVGLNFGWLCFGSL